MLLHRWYWTGKVPLTKSVSFPQQCLVHLRCIGCLKTSNTQLYFLGKEVPDGWPEGPKCIIEEKKRPVIIQDSATFSTDVLILRRQWALTKQVGDLHEIETATTKTTEASPNLVILQHMFCHRSMLFFSALRAPKCYLLQLNGLHANFHWMNEGNALNWSTSACNSESKWLPRSQKVLFSRYVVHQALSSDWLQNKGIRDSDRRSVVGSIYTVRLLKLHDAVERFTKTFQDGSMWFLAILSKSFISLQIRSNQSTDG